MEKYGTYLRLTLTTILIMVPILYLLLRGGKKSKKIRIHFLTLLKERQHSKQIKKELQEKKESIINPKAESTSDTDENFQEVIEDALQDEGRTRKDKRENEERTNEEKTNQQENNDERTNQPENNDERTNESKNDEENNSKNSSKPIFGNLPNKSSEIFSPSPSEKKQLDRILVEANFLKNEGKFEDYEKKIIEGLALAPTNLELTKLLADLYFTLGSHKKALSLLKKIIERDPEDHKSLRQIGEIYFINGDNQTAELLVEKAIHLKPDSPKYNLSLVEIYYNTNRINDAIACMEKIIKLRPANTNYLLTLAELYEEINDTTNAKKYYFNILEFEPSNEKAKKKRKQYSE